jgi:hypothetical protein
MATGDIINWNKAIQSGLIREDGDGVHGVQGSNCTARLLAILATTNIIIQNAPRTVHP